MPEIRASLNTDLHRRLKAEAAHEGVHLKQLVADILQEHVKNHGGARKKQTFSTAQPLRHEGPH